MHGAAKAPAALRRRNTALSAGLFLLALLAAMWDKMAQWADAAWQFIKRVVFAVIRFFMNLLPAIDQGAGRGEGGGGMPEGLMEAGETSPLALFLEKVMYVVVSILFAAIVVIAVRVLYKKLKVLLRKIAERFRLYASRAAEDYVDEAESTLNWEEKTESLRSRMKEAMRKTRKQAKWEELDGRAARQAKRSGALRARVFGVTSPRNSTSSVMTTVDAVAPMSPSHMAKSRVAMAVPPMFTRLFPTRMAESRLSPSSVRARARPAWALPC